MEQLQYEFDGHESVPSPREFVLAGVVSSGNLEVMIEPLDLGGRMRIEVTTVARGFAPIWEAVLRDFNQRHPLRDVRISVNDVGATPAVVSLRLDQAAEAFEGDAG